MPTQIDIHNGPGLGDIIFHSPLFGCFFHSTFTVTKKGTNQPIDRKHEHSNDKEPLLVTGEIVGILYDKRDLPNTDAGKKTEEHSTVPQRLSIILVHQTIRWEMHYLAFKYSLKTRKGGGWHFTEEEFFTCNNRAWAVVGSNQGATQIHLPIYALLNPREMHMGSPTVE